MRYLTAHNLSLRTSYVCHDTLPFTGGDSNRQTLQRIYGVAFPKKEELDEYLQRLEEAKRRDHRKLGKELGLFMMADEGPGFPFFLPKGGSFT